MTCQIFQSSDRNVSKFVFEGENVSVEAVLYWYNSYKERTVICCSTQCGCPVGCTFCGTGKFFVRSLTSLEIVEQVNEVVSHVDCDTNDIAKFQIMFMSMGEPFLNFDNLAKAIHTLARIYPNAQLLVSTSAPQILIKCWPEFIVLPKHLKQIGIQFSVHESSDCSRKKLIPTNTMELSQIAQCGEAWSLETKRRPFFNYCVHEGNSSERNVTELIRNFDPDVWECTLSVICEKDSTMQNAINQKLDLINGFSEKMMNAGYSIRVFNPAGQDDIGGGCGQLWYFQEWVNKNKNS